MDMNERKESFWARNWQWFVSIVVFIAFVAFAILLIYCTWPQKQPDLQDLLDNLKKQTTTVKGPLIVKHETTTSRNVPVCDVWGRVVTPSMTTTETSSTTQMSNLPESYVVSQEDMDKILTTVALTARKDALDEYKENFSILLAILAVFGIAWPAIVALLQFRFNEGELKKIKEAEKKATTANELANDMKKSMEEFEGRMNTSFTAQLDIQNAIQKSSQEIEQLKIGLCREISIIYSELGIVCVLNLKQMSNLNEAFVHLIIDMGFSSLKYACQLGDTPDAALELINCVYTLKTPLFSKKENQDYLNKKWEKLNKEQLKNICTDEQYQALEKMCSVENKKAPGDSK